MAVDGRLEYIDKEMYQIALGIQTPTKQRAYPFSRNKVESKIKELQETLEATRTEVSKRSSL